MGIVINSNMPPKAAAKPIHLNDTQLNNQWVAGENEIKSNGETPQARHLEKMLGAANLVISKTEFNGFLAEHFDSDPDADIDKDSFVLALQHFYVKASERIDFGLCFDSMVQFHKKDCEGGALNKDAFIKTIASCGDADPKSESAATETFELADADGSGFIDREEFINYMNHRFYGDELPERTAPKKGKK